MPAPRREIYPLTFHPQFKKYPWGGRNLETRLGRRLPPGRVAESWEISGHPNGPTAVAEGALRGQTLAKVQTRLGETLLGRRSRKALERGRFPLLVKLLDAHRWLSIQVHPDDAYASRQGDDLGKTEMWVVLHAEPGAELLYGFRPGVDRPAFEHAIAERRVPELLHRVAAGVGDVFFVPPGTVHALGPGLILAEVQQSSDTTYRIYDWDRSGDDRRPLHLERALEVLDFGLVEPGPVGTRLLREGPPRIEELVICPYFGAERIWVPAGGAYRGACEGESFEIWMLLEGCATLSWDGPDLGLEAVSSILLPAALGGFELRAAKPSICLRLVVP